MCLGRVRIALFTCYVTGCLSVLLQLRRRAARPDPVYQPQAPADRLELPQQFPIVEDDWVLIEPLAPAAQDIPANANLLEESTPYGSFHYNFEEKTVPGQLPCTLRSEAEAARIVDEIREKYQSVLRKRKAIADHLTAFKRGSGAKEDSDFPSCYREIQRRLPHRKDKIILAKENPLQINIVPYNDPPPESIQRAVDRFNTMMLNSHAFVEDTNTVVKDIEERLEMLEKNIVSMAVQMKHKECKKIPAEIKGCVREVRCMIHDVVAAKDSFTADSDTGLHTSIDLQ